LPLFGLRKTVALIFLRQPEWSAAVQAVSCFNVDVVLLEHSFLLGTVWIAVIFNFCLRNFCFLGVDLELTPSVMIAEVRRRNA
jgi:hypothetical protein